MPERYSVSRCTCRSSPSYNAWPALDAKHVFPKNLGKQRYWTGVWMLRASERCSDESLFWLGLAQIELQMQNQQVYFLNDHVTALNMVEWWTYRCDHSRCSAASFSVPSNQTLRVALRITVWTFICGPETQSDTSPFLTDKSCFCKL